MREMGQTCYIGGDRMSKTLYYRETNPKTGKQKWIKLEGVSSSGTLLFITSDIWGEKPDLQFTNSFSIVYKETSKDKRLYN